MSHLSYEESKKLVMRGLLILAIVTLLEVFVALLGKGYISKGFHLPVSVMYILMIGMSLYKAYFIVYYFMHMKYEVPGLVKSVLLPTLLLVWAVIAFFTEGKTWHDWRARKNDRPIAVLSGVTTHSEHKNNEHKQEAKMEENATPAIDTTKKEEAPSEGHSTDSQEKKDDNSHH